MFGLELQHGEQSVDPLPELAPPSIKHLQLEKRVEIWAQLVNECDALVRAGLRAKIGSKGDFEEAYRQCTRGTRKNMSVSSMLTPRSLRGERSSMVSEAFPADPLPTIG